MIRNQNFDSVHESISIYSCKLQRFYKIEETRASEIAAQWVHAFMVPSPSRPLIASDFRCFPLSLPFEAKLHLGRRRALTLIQENDPDQGLAWRVRAMAYLAQEDTPLYTIEQLTLNMRMFYTYMLKHKQRLIDTGLPHLAFRGCPWLYHKLGRLYDVKSASSYL